ncbi:hypothetical protein ACFLX9_01825 [Chloroflexota bacterium]
MVEGQVIDELTVRIEQGAVSVDLKTSQVDVDLPSLKLRVEESVGTLVNVLGYLSGYAFWVDVESALDPLGKKTTFGASAKEIADTKGERPFEWQAVYEACERVSSFPRALADLRNAILFANDTGFYCYRCYRAMETVRQYFETEKGISDIGKAWEAMGADLLLDRSWLIDLAKTFTQPQRHGKRQSMTAQERIKAMKYAWRVIARFLIYMHRGFQPLPANEFDLLCAQ